MSIVKNVKRTFLDLLANVGMRSAIRAAGAASSLGYHQPKEPKALQEMKK